MTDTNEKAFLTALHSVLKFVFEPLLRLCSSIIQVCYVFFNRTDGSRLPPWLVHAPPSPSSDDQESTTTSTSVPQLGSTQQTFLSTLSRQLGTKSKHLPESKAHRPRIEER